MTEEIPDGLGSDFNSHVMKHVSGPSQSGSFSDHNSGTVFHGHEYYIIVCRYDKQSVAKYQQIPKLHHMPMDTTKHDCPFQPLCCILIFNHLNEQFQL